MNIKTPVSSLFQTYHKELTAQEINTECYTGADIVDNLCGYLLSPGEIVKGVYGVGKQPYVGFATKLGIGILIKTRGDDRLHFAAYPLLSGHVEVRKIVGGNSVITTADELYRLLTLFNNNTI